MQPHRYTRLSSLFNEFCTCFNDADSVIVAPVYAAGEAPIEGATHTHLAEGLHGARASLGSYHRAAGSNWPRWCADMRQSGDIVVCLGAGTITPMGLCAARPAGRP